MVRMADEELDRHVVDVRGRSEVAGALPLDLAPRVRIVYRRMLLGRRSPGANPVVIVLTLAVIPPPVATDHPVHDLQLREPLHIIRREQREARGGSLRRYRYVSTTRPRGPPYPAHTVAVLGGLHRNINECLGGNGVRPSDHLPAPPQLFCRYRTSGRLSMPSVPDLDMAVAHWHVNGWGGAEYLVTALADVLDVDRVYTVGPPAPDQPNPYGDVEWVDVVDGLSARPLRRIQARTGRLFEYTLWEDVDWRAAGPGRGPPDVLVTSGATTRAVITPDHTLQVHYCHSPPRWFYDLYHDRKDSAVGILARPVLRHLRTRDLAVDPRVDHYLANSPVIARRIWKYYKREADVLYPPVDIDAYRSEGEEGYYLHLGRLDVEKGASAVVEAFVDTDRELVLAGGPGDAAGDVLDDVNRTPNISYRGFVDEGEKIDLLANCRALVFNARNEDFGIVPIEAMAAGKAVLTRDEGYPSRVVTPGETGYHHDGSPQSIQSTVERFERDGIAGDPREHVRAFSWNSFADQLIECIDEAYSAFDRRF